MNDSTEKDANTSAATGATQGADSTNANPSMALRAQYIKDASFENPRAPQSVFGLDAAPKMEVSVNLGAQRLDENVFELVIQINARAIHEKSTIFLVDLAYAGVLEMQNVPEEALEQLVFVQGAFLLFPYARRVVSDLTRDGGFPPLQVDPIDFMAMYVEQQNKAQRAAEAAEKTPAESAPKDA
jgi:preprotein translocase subunit SecB